MAILNNSNAISSGGYDINNSLRFRSSASAYLNRTFATTGTNNKIQTFSAWVKRGLLSSSANYRLMGCYNGSASYSTEINFSNDALRIEFGGSAAYELKTTQVFRDPSAWYHIVLAIDTTQATSSNRIKMYVNGSQITAFATANYPAQNDTSQLTSANANNKIGANWSNSEPFDGYMAEVNFIDGQALTPSSFGETDTTTGSWKPKAYTSTYGTNGFYLKFSDIATTSGSNAGLGKDFSGNANYWTTNNISVTAGTTYDAMIDSPTLTSATVANYATLNPLQSSVALTAGNLDFSSGGGESCPKATIQLPLTGKWYWETYCSATGTDNWIGVTIDQTGTTFTSGGIYRAYRKTGVKESNGTSSAYGASWAAGDTLGVAVDMDAGTIVFYKNGTSQGTAYSDLAGIQWTVFVYGYINAGHQVNFGQRPFAYTPPTGFVRLNTFNLPDSTIKKGNTVMDATLYTGNGASRTVTNAGSFKTDLVWVKSRSSGATWHILADSVRGAGYQLSSNQTNAEIYDAQGVGFASNGFTLGADTVDAYYGWNLNGDTYVGWQWQAGQGTTSSNTSGTITSTVSVNATAGFSIVLYTGNGGAMTIGHGLGVAPKLIILKDRDIGRPWPVYHGSLATNQYLILNTTAAAATSTSYWNNTAPTSTVFSVNGLEGNVGANGEKYVAYCWAEIAGFSKFGSYTGNGSADGPFVYTGFRPKFILWKSSTDGARNWSVFDSSRNTYNVTNSYLLPNLSNAEGTSDACDFLSNGFKWRSTDAGSNGSGQTFIYMAFAENPFKNANAR